MSARSRKLRQHLRERWPRLGPFETPLSLLTIARNDLEHLLDEADEADRLRRQLAAVEHELAEAHRG